MFIDRLLNDGNAPVIEASARFAAARHRLLAENIANVDTPGYVQKDLSPAKFQAMLSERLDERTRSAPGTVGFDDLNAKIENPAVGILFHDRNNRSMEQLMTDGVKNALFHNMMMELLKKQFSSIELALKERVG
jgi:flagellar basal-body rod protein FlgB